MMRGLYPALESAGLDCLFLAFQPGLRAVQIVF